MPRSRKWHGALVVEESQNQNMKIMRKMIIAAIAVLGLTMTAPIATNAQQSVVRGQHPSVITKGDFNNSLVSSTTLKTWTSRDNASFPLLYTVLDSVNGTAGTDATEVDTVKTQLVGEYNSVTLGFYLTKIGGRVDSFTVTYWGSIDGSNYVSLTSQTATNTAGTKAYSYVVNSGVGNPYTHYMMTAACTNIATASEGAWKCYLLVR